MRPARQFDFLAGEDSIPPPPKLPAIGPERNERKARRQSRIVEVLVAVAIGTGLGVAAAALVGLI